MQHLTSSPMRTGGGTFDPHEENVYFLASNTERLLHGWEGYRHLLVAVNELEGEDSRAFFVKAVNASEKRVFLDSGVYNLSTQYARREGITMDVALSTAPEQIEGFTTLFDRYVDIVRTYGDRLWGYIEIDQGGRENKIRTRTRLESLGLHPIPVYHPLNDGWDYFDYLAERYDRICFGNIVKADARTRLRLLATVWQRHRRYPHLWIHLLGLTPNQWLNALPINSGDSSTWLAPMRWPTFPVSSDGCAVGQMGRQYCYVTGSEPDGLTGNRKNTTLSAYMAHMNMLCWRTHLSDLKHEGIVLYPPLHEWEVITRASDM